MPRPVIVAHHTRSGLAALNVVTAALQTDALTDAVEVRFARDRAALAAELVSVAGEGGTPVAAWSFYSPDFLASAGDLAWVAGSVLVLALPASWTTAGVVGIVVVAVIVADIAILEYLGLRRISTAN